MCMKSPRRAPKGSAKDSVGLFVQVAPDVYQAYVDAAAGRGITKRRLIEAAIRRELAEPTVHADADQEELPLKTA